MRFDQFATGKRIQTLRKAKRLTQEEFAIEFNISDRHMRSIEKGEYTPSLELFVDIAVFFNVTLDFLILGVLVTPREKQLSNQLMGQTQKIRDLRIQLCALLQEFDEIEIKETA